MYAFSPLKPHASNMLLFIHLFYLFIFKKSTLQVVFLTISWLGEVDISVSQGSPGDHVPAYPNRKHRSGWAEFLVQHSLRDVRVQVANVERSHRITPRRCVHISEFTK